MIRVLAINEELFGRAHPKTPAIHSNLVLVQLTRGDADRAAALWDQVHEPPLHTRGESLFFGALLNNAGWYFMGENRLAEADSCLRHSLRIHRRVLPPDHVRRAALNNNMAVFLRRTAPRDLAKTLTAMTIVGEIGDIRRFRSPRQLMGYTGLVPRKRSSGERQWRGSITRSGNRFLRRVLVESAWHYSKRGGSSLQLNRRRMGQDPAVVGIAVKAQHRLQICDRSDLTRDARGRQLRTGSIMSLTIARISV